MTTTKMTRQWYRWAGTIQDIERATRLALEVLSQRTRTETPCQIEIAFPQRVIDADNPDALGIEIDTRDLDLIRSIRIHVGSKRGFRATIHVEREAPALTVEVVGEDRTRVEGLTSQLEDLLRKGGQPGGANLEGGLGIVILLIIPLGVLAGFAIDALHGSAEYVVLGAVFSLVIALAYTVPWLLPSLQLLKPGEQTRLRRFRLAVIAFVSSVIASLAATVIYEVLR